MKKNRILKRVLALFCGGILATSLLAGCANTESTTTQTEDTQEETNTTDAEESGSNEETTVEEISMKYGKITAINGNEITLALGELPDFTSMEKPIQGEDGTAPEGEAPNGDMPEGEAPSGDIPEGEVPSGDIPEGEVPAGFSENITLTGEEITITISDSTVITINGVAKTVSDLQVDDVITVQVEEDTVVSISSGMPAMGNGNGKERPVAEGTLEVEETTTEDDSVEE